MSNKIKHNVFKDQVFKKPGGSPSLGGMTNGCGDGLPKGTDARFPRVTTVEPKKGK